MKRTALNRELSAASALLEQGVPSEVIATAFHNEAITEEARELMGRIGHTKRAAYHLFPMVRKETVLFRSFLLSVFTGACLVLLYAVSYFLKKREQSYQEAASIVTQYSEGNFDCHLPGNEEGTIYQLYGAVEQLALALQAKSEAEHQSKEFLKDTISDISHQLKTPLAALNMYTEIIMDEPEHPETVRNFAEKTMRSLERMEELIQSLLKVMRLDAGSIVFEKEECRIAELAKKSCQELQERANREKKQILFSGSQDETMVCDPGWTCEAMGNLLKNALDHTEEGGIILVSWYRSPAMLRIMVEDDGSGIAPEDIHHIFKRFYRSKHSSSTQGVGLGLPLAKAVVEGQGGVISVQSTPGKGSTFLLSFLTDL
ncbi:MAG: HAMP domain-containing sensor histidine kinase [Lachnospiraceae bacterium]|nr:HAMP domain-containing sensor histidine kinase [Lachnospiraceae bacterium]